MEKKKPVIYYIYDALCGWCYGFAPVVVKLQQELGNKVHFKVISGGMVTGSRVGPIRQMADFIRKASPRVTEITGVKFGDAYLNGILDDGKYVSNSLPPAIALNILRAQKPEKQIHFAHAIQQLLYAEGRDLNLSETYLPLAKEAGLKPEEFMTRFADPAFREDVEKEFTLVQNWGINGFPAVIVEKQDKLYLVAQGFLPFDALLSTVKEVLENEPDNSPAATE